jgi:hypothetical protein
MSQVTRHFPFPSTASVTTNLEDTKEEYLELAVIAFDRLADKAMAWIER